MPKPNFPPGAPIITEQEARALVAQALDENRFSKVAIADGKRKGQEYLNTGKMQTQIAGAGFHASINVQVVYYPWEKAVGVGTNTPATAEVLDQVRKAMGL